jgi:hypothetical protein
MLTIIFLAVGFALLSLGAVFAFMAKDQARKGQSGSPQAASGARQGRAPGLD